MRQRLHPIALCALFSFGTFGCTSPQASGTKTNWFERCDRDAECGEEGSCICGLCTDGCSDANDCQTGVCGSEIATAVECGTDSDLPSQVCLPESSETACDELPLALGSALGQAEACPLPNSLVCESFDSPLSSEASTWTVNNASGALQECVTRAGSGALVERTDGEALIQTRFRLPDSIQEGTLHVRFFFRINSSSVLPDQTTIFEFWDQESRPVNQTSILVQSNGALGVFVSQGSYSLFADPSTSLPRDNWVCLEIEDKLGQGDGRLTVRVDGETVLESSELTTQPENPLTVAVLQTQPIMGNVGNPVEFYFDELVIGTAPIGCD